jgi:hypothetical protein
VHPAFVESLAETYRELRNVTWRRISGCADIVLARNDLLHQFRFASNDDLIVFIDADISWHVADLLNVLGPLEVSIADVCAGMYQMKVPGPVQFVGDLLEQDCDEQKGYVGPTLNYCYRVSSIGFGFFAMTRKAVEEIVKHCASYCPVHGRSVTNRLDERQALLFRGEIASTDQQPDLPRYFGEDVSACRTIREAGFDIWCARDTKLGHHAGQHCYNAQLNVDALSRRLAFQSDVMRHKAADRPVSQYNERVFEVSRLDLALK